MSLLAVSIAVSGRGEVAEAIERARRAGLCGARLVEWRIDGMSDDAEGIRATIDLISRSPVPCILTRRPRSEGGRCDDTDARRCAFFTSVLASGHVPRYIDVELAALQRDPGPWWELAQSLSDRTSLILSTHDFEDRPSDLLQRVEAMVAEPACDVVKVAWRARSLRDNLEAFDLLRDRHKPTIALCMGGFGRPSRILASKFGGLLTFATDDPLDATAPGQPTVEELTGIYRIGRVNARTKVYGVVGWPVEHSLGPAVHNAGFEAVGHDGIYLPLPIPPEYEHFKATMAAMLDHAALDFRGASVTIPHKENLLRFVKERGGTIEPLAQHIGAANTLIVHGDGAIECVNTDAPAAAETLCAGMGIRPRQLDGKRIAVIGAGGAARAVAAGLLQQKATVVVFNRHSDRADALVEDLSRVLAFAGGTIATGNAEKLGCGCFDVIINCTPIGMTGGPDEHGSPLSGFKDGEAALNGNVAVFDTVYAPRVTPLLKVAERRGATVISGEEMFICQAVMQFEKWTQRAAPRETFAAVVRGRANG